MVITNEHLSDPYSFCKTLQEAFEVRRLPVKVLPPQMDRLHPYQEVGIVVVTDTPPVEKIMQSYAMVYDDFAGYPELVAWHIQYARSAYRQYIPIDNLGYDWVMRIVHDFREGIFINMGEHVTITHETSPRAPLLSPPRRNWRDALRRFGSSPRTDPEDNRLGRWIMETFKL